MDGNDRGPGRGPRRTTSKRKLVVSFHMRNAPDGRHAGQPPSTPTEFGYHLMRLINAAGYPSNAAFARAAGVSGSTLNRVINGGVERPDADTLAKLADALVPTSPKTGRADRVAEVHTELLWAAGYRIGDAPAARQLDPHALEIDQMLDPASPLPERDRTALRLLLDSLLPPYREAMLRARRKRTG